MLLFIVLVVSSLVWVWVMKVFRWFFSDRVVCLNRLKCWFLFMVGVSLIWFKVCCSLVISEGWFFSVFCNIWGMGGWCMVGGYSFFIGFLNMFFF